MSCWFPRRLQDVFSVTNFRLTRRLTRCLEDVSARRLEAVLKTSWKTKNCYPETVLKMSSRRLGNHQMFTGIITNY